MSEDKKPKEFWLHKAYQMPWTIHDKSISTGHELEKEIHVIEFKAYEIIEQKLALAVDALETGIYVLSYYSDPSVWGVGMPGKKVSIGPEDQEEVFVDGRNDVRGGMLAREINSELINTLKNLKQPNKKGE
jgi:hypothetical protein